MATKGIRPGVYNQEYFSGSQVGIFIGDIWVDEITSFEFMVGQSKSPLYGYSDELFRDVTQGRVLVQGQFSINFKEAGYLFLILDRYRKKMKNLKSISETTVGQNISESMRGAFVQDQFINQQNIEQVVNGETSVFNNNQLFASLAGFSSSTRAGARNNVFQQDSLGRAENLFEQFENAVWGHQTTAELDINRRSDDHRLNPFDIYIGYGDFHDDTLNHTIQRITDVHILNSQKGFAADGRPIQEVYTFIARNVI